MRLLLGSDFHINESKRLEDTIDVLNQIVQATRTLKPDWFISLGDIFDKRKPTPKEMRVVNAWIMQMRDLVDSIVLLEGNHDQDNGISALSYLEDLEIGGVSVVSPPFLLGMQEENQMYFGHEQVDGAMADNGIKLTGGTRLGDLIRKYPNCEVFAFGHFHKPQILNESPLAFYVGSIDKTSFSQRDDQKRLWLFEDAKLISSIPLKTRPMFQFEFNVGIDHSRSVIFVKEYLKFEGALVKIIFKGPREILKTVNVEAYRAHILGVHKAKDLKIVFEVTDKTKSRNEKVTENVTEESALKEFFKDNEDQEKLVSTGMEIIKEVGLYG